MAYTLKDKDDDDDDNDEYMRDIYKVTCIMSPVLVVVCTTNPCFVVLVSTVCSRWAAQWLLVPT
jgi:hypothetical protein